METNLYQFDEDFRNTLTTVDAQGKRVWIYPKKPAGYLHRWRVAVSVFLLALLLIGPFITVHNRPLLLLNVFERKFILFGQVFWPQDFFLLAMILITAFVFITLFTVAFGRLWCGWACPQTLFMEMVFRKIEYWIEGDANDQRKLQQAAWNASKILRKTFKQLAFLVVACIIAHTVMAYIIGGRQVLALVSQPPATHLPGFIGLAAFTLIFYAVFAHFREQACTVVCPYGRLQSVLLVKTSIVVAYNWLRGEPRGQLQKNKVASNTGDCIDCRLCVHVCPTGIDIRNGTQLECINCTACIDACDEVMRKINKPKRLIGYASNQAIENGTQKIMTPRLAGYAVVLTALLGMLGFLIFTQQDVEITALKAPGTLYAKTDDGQIANLYHIELTNKTTQDMPLELRIEQPPGASLTKISTGQLTVPKEAMMKELFLIKLPEDNITAAKMVITVGAYYEGRRIAHSKINFVGPLKMHR